MAGNLEPGRVINNSRMTAYRASAIAGTLAICILSTLLYAPYLNNSLIFDDHGIFTNRAVFDLAQTIFDFRPRTFPYFTLGFIHVLTNDIAANRIFSLALHILCALGLFALITTLLRDVLTADKTSDLLEKAQLNNRISLCAFICATWFALHPISVYGAAYLAQRTILFATLFSLLTIWFYRNACVKDRLVDLVAAAICYSAAVFSKEHAIMLPALALFSIGLSGTSPRKNLKRAIVFILLCTPAALAAIFAVKFVIATAYEPDAASLSSQLQSEGFRFIFIDNLWALSAISQSNLFFDYLKYWFFPDVRALSIDMRIDFFGSFDSKWTLLFAVFFLAVPGIALYLIRLKRLYALFGIGLAYCWILFLTELSTVRIQEPFVLYRSYLWAPGYAFMLAAILFSINRKFLVVLSCFTFALFLHTAGDRLSSMKDDGTIWKDAAAKLQSPTLLGSDRIFYNRGIQYQKEQKYDAAITDISFAISKNPTRHQLYYARGNVYLSKNSLTEALADFTQVTMLNPAHGPGYYRQGLVYEKAKCFNEAAHAYRKSAQLGVFLAETKLVTINKNIVSQAQQEKSICFSGQIK